MKQKDFSKVANAELVGLVKYLSRSWLWEVCFGWECAFIPRELLEAPELLVQETKTLVRSRIKLEASKLPGVLRSVRRAARNNTSAIAAAP